MRPDSRSMRRPEPRRGEFIRNSARFSFTPFAAAFVRFDFFEFVRRFRLGISELRYSDVRTASESIGRVRELPLRWISGEEARAMIEPVRMSTVTGLEAMEKAIVKAPRSMRSEERRVGKEGRSRWS